MMLPNMNEKRYFRTSELAKAVGIHPNTVRLYEQWGFLSPVERSPSGYRRFTERHLDQLRLARLAFHCNVVGGDVRQALLDMVLTAAKGDLGGALEKAYIFLTTVKAERAQAEAAAQFLERWASGVTAATSSHPMRIGDVARLLNTTIDSIRNWERNGLIDVPRDPQNGYRQFGADEIGRLRVIRMLIRSGYSTMAILRMLTKFDEGQTENLREVLDTPQPEEDVLYVRDHWLSILTDAEDVANKSVALLEEVLAKG
jgi:DNA-binding transcriptional MerR regulator